jgi:hypothetical protein
MKKVDLIAIVEANHIVVEVNEEFGQFFPEIFDLLAQFGFLIFSDHPIL